MSLKRPHAEDDVSASEDEESLEPISSANNPVPSHYVQAKIDPTYGQRSAFPGLDGDPGDDNSFYGPASDGLEYLRMVRSEAKGVPNLLVAPSSPEPQQEAIYTDYPQGYYSNGAYTAVPLLSARSSSKQARAGKYQDPQDAYYTSLCSRFNKFQTIMQSAPLTSKTSPKVTLLKRNRRAVWRGSILKTQPIMSDLSSLSQENIVYGLELLGDLLTMDNMKSGQYGRNLGTWAWALLGRCRPMGEMGSEEVAVLRDLGKQAVWVMRRIVAGGVVDERWDEAGSKANGDDDEDGLDGLLYALEEVDEGSIDAPSGSAAPNDHEDDALNVAQKRLLSTLEIDTTMGSHAHDSSVEQELGTEGRRRSPESVKTVENGIGETTPQANILATLDVIITIIGELYGQRDLLEGRLLWDEFS